MYFLFDVSPSLSISILIVFFISKKIKIKSKNNKAIFKTNKNCKFLFDSSINPLPKKVKKVKKPMDSVIINKNIKYMFFLIKLAIPNKQSI